MTVRSNIGRILRQEDINFLLTNRIPRIALTRFMGWFSRIEQPLVRDASIALWRLFCDLELDDAGKSRFRSVHDCFIRELRDGARTIDPDPCFMASPCDAIVGACGRLDGTRAFQAKGFPYRLEDLLGGDPATDWVRDGCYATLRITAGMYHRFHAPHDCRVEQITYFSGDTWNVNPIALKRIERLFCRNERAALRLRLEQGGHPLVMVPVAAVLVAGICFNFLPRPLDLAYKGPNIIPCSSRFRKGAEMGWFQHGSTILVFAPAGFSLCDNIREGSRVRVGERLMRLPPELPTRAS